MISAYYSQRFEDLFHHLASSIYKKKPFEKSMVIVPSQFMKQRVQMELAAQKGVAAGIDWYSLHAACVALYQLLTKTKMPPSYSCLSLSLKLEKRMQALFQEYPCAPTSRKDLLRPLYDYLKDKDHEWEQNRLNSFSRALGKLFDQYGVYGKGAFQRQPGQADEDWQSFLWHELFHGEQKSLYDLWEKLPRLFAAPVRVHLVGFSFLSRLHLHFFRQIAPYVNLSFHLLSPTKAFWSDIRSAKERRRLQNIWKKEGVKRVVRENLDDLMEDVHPLLAEWGKLGRTLAGQIEEDIFAIRECYSMPASLKDHARFADYVEPDLTFTQSAEQGTLLQFLQTELLFMTHRRDGPLVELEETCPSVQVHAAPNMLRVVQSLYQQLLHILHAHPSIDPGDVLVMAPNIVEYVPFIKAVFDKKESPFSYQFADLRLASQNSFSDGLLKLLDLPTGRWRKGDLLSLIDHPRFREKQGFSREDVKTFKLWVEQASIYWGIDEKHSQEVLEREYGRTWSAHHNHFYSWQEGMQRLVYGLALSAHPASACIDLTQTALLGKLIELLRSLHEDLTCLADGTQMSVQEWLRYLHCLLETYLFNDPMDEEIGRQKQELIQQIQSLQPVAQQVEEDFPFASLRDSIKELLTQESASFNEGRLSAIRFSSLLPMRALPAKVICLLGMEEGSFPRAEVFLSFDRTRDPSTDYCPSRADYDRYLFLECLLSARRFFLIFYQNQDAKGETPPSTLVSRLIEHIEYGYSLSGKSFSDVAFIKHPLQSFDESYFLSPLLKGAGKREYALALLSRQEKKPAATLFPDLQAGVSVMKAGKSLSEGERIFWRHLIQTFRNPLKTYLEEALGLFIKEDKETCDEPQLAFSSIHCARLRKEMMNKAIDAVFEQEESSGKLPPGIFKKLSISWMQQEERQMRQYLKDWGCENGSYFSLRLDPAASQPGQDGQGNWIVPALRFVIDGKTILLIGTLENLCDKGMLLFCRPSKGDSYRYMPEFLVLSFLQKEFGLPLQPKLLFVRTGDEKTGPAYPLYEHLKQMVQYHLLCMTNPCPLLPEWIDCFLQQDENALQQMIDQDLGSDHFFNLQAKFAFPFSSPQASGLLKAWQKTAQQIFQVKSDAKL